MPLFSRDQAAQRASVWRTRHTHSSFTQECQTSSLSLSFLPSFVFLPGDVNELSRETCLKFLLSCAFWGADPRIGFGEVKLQEQI